MRYFYRCPVNGVLNFEIMLFIIDKSGKTSVTHLIFWNANCLFAVMHAGRFILSQVSDLIDRKTLARLATYYYYYYGDKYEKDSVYGPNT